MEQLPAEVLDLILGKLYYAGHREDLRSISLVSSRYNSAVIRWIFRRFPYRAASQPDVESLLDRYKKKGIDLCHDIRELVVRGQKKSASKEEIDQVRKMIRDFTGMKRFVWRQGYLLPLTILQELEANTELMGYNIRSNIDGKNLQKQVKLSNALKQSGRQIALELELSYPSPGLPRSYSSVLINIPSLRFLSFVGEGWGTELLLQDGHQIPFVESLHLSDCGLEKASAHIQNFLPALKHLYIKDSTDLHLGRIFGILLEKVDTDKLWLETLSMTCNPGVVVNDEDHALVRFLSSFRGLKDLELNELHTAYAPGIMVECLQLHRSTLTKLNIFEGELHMKMSSLFEMGKDWPCLQELTWGRITCSPGTEKFPSTKDGRRIFQSMSALRKITVFVLPNLWGESPQPPVEGEAFALQGANELWAPNLETLYLNVGEGVRMGIVWRDELRMAWEERYRTQWKIQYHQTAKKAKNYVMIRSIRDLASEWRTHRLKTMADTLGEKCNPPADLHRYYEWRKSLEERYKQHMDDERLERLCQDWYQKPASSVRPQQKARVLKAVLRAHPKSSPLLPFDPPSDEAAIIRETDFWTAAWGHPI